MISCDNAHAVHPNYTQKTDEGNCAYINEGIVVKSHAGQKYTSDGVSIAIFKAICEKAGVPLQYFANRSDMAGGSTLGNLAMAQVSMKAVDIGLPQLAMHSPFERRGPGYRVSEKSGRMIFSGLTYTRMRTGRSGWKQSNCSLF